MGATKLLTGLPPKHSSFPDLSRTLAEAGLELWQAPEGFWAIRLKQAATPVMAKPTGRLRRAR